MTTDRHTCHVDERLDIEDVLLAETVRARLATSSGSSDFEDVARTLGFDPYEFTPGREW